MQTIWLRCLSVSELLATVSSLPCDLVAWHVDKFKNLNRLSILQILVAGVGAMSKCLVSQDVVNIMVWYDNFLRSCSWHLSGLTIPQTKCKILCWWVCCVIVKSYVDWWSAHSRGACDQHTQHCEASLLQSSMYLNAHALYLSAHVW